MLVSRPALGCVSLGLFLGLGFPTSVFAVPQVYNFEGFAAGTVVSGARPNGEILPQDLYSGFDISVDADMINHNSLCIFDSDNPTGNDIDLGTPNSGFGGPGIGDGGRPGEPGENNIPYHKI